MMLHKTMIAAGLAIAATCGVASAQNLPEGRVYTFHSKAQGSCPALDWHVVAESNGVLSGMIAWNNMQQMARAQGTLNASARTFDMKAVEVGGQGRTAEITGTVRQDGWLIANINGPGVACKGVNIPWGVTPQGVTGGNG
jgi:hypothetical protein